MKLQEALRTLKKAGFIVENEQTISEQELAEQIIANYEQKYKTKLENDDERYLDIAYYIAAFYANMDHTPVIEMLRNGTTALRDFIVNAERQSIKRAVELSRRVRNSKPKKKIDWIEDLKAAAEQQEAEDEEERWQAHKETDAYKHRNDPGWRGPNGRWTLD